MGEGAFIDTEADPGAWSDALAAPCSFRTITEYDPRANTRRGPLTETPCGPNYCARRLGLFSFHHEGQ